MHNVCSLTLYGVKLSKRGIIRILGYKMGSKLYVGNFFNSRQKIKDSFIGQFRLIAWCSILSKMNVFYKKTE